MRNRLGALAIALTLSALATPQAAACDCVCRDPRVRDSVDVIFDGRPASSVESSGWGQTRRDDYRETRFRVTRIWRSDALDDDAAIRAGSDLAVRTPLDESICGVTFQDDAENFVLARRDDDGVLWAYLCDQYCARRQAAIDFLAGSAPEAEE